jgi:peptidyl-prolyl cis-trans isomerase C
MIGFLRLRPALAVAAVLSLVAFGAAGQASAEDAAPAAGAPAAAPAEPDESAVVARVNGEDITQQDIALALQDFRETLQQLPVADRLPALINGFIDIRLMARAAEAAGLDKQTDVEHYLAYTRDRALRGIYLQDKLFAGIDEAAIQKRYDEETAKFVPEDEIHAVHILVASEDDAKAIIEALDKGGDFAELAKEKSTDTMSGQSGGDLGFFTKEKMVPEFSEAAFALQPGEYTKVPVKSRFGYHVIKVLEKRPTVMPTLAEKHEEIVSLLRRDAFLAESAALRKDATIEIIDPEANASTPAPDAAPAKP